MALACTTRPTTAARPPTSPLGEEAEHGEHHRDAREHDAAPDRLGVAPGELSQLILHEGAPGWTGTRPPTPR